VSNQTAAGTDAQGVSEMFDKLIESEPKGADFKDRRRYFAVSSVVVGILFTTAVVVSIFAADYGLGSTNFEIVEMIAPVAPEIPQPGQLTASTSSSQSELPTRQINMARVDEPTIAPTTVSTTQNSQMARTINRFKFGPDGNPAGPVSSGRETGFSGPIGPGLGETVAKNEKSSESEEPPPPPSVIKRPDPPKLPVSGGVLNGKARDLPKPNYPATARAVGAQGEVVVQVTIDESGTVISANAIRGHVLLRADAVKAARNARFFPTRLSDIPVKVTGIITYNFTR